MHKFKISNRIKVNHKKLFKKKKKKNLTNSIKRISMDKLNNQPARINSKGFSSSTSSFQLLEAQMGHYVQENQQLLRLD